MTGFKTTQGSSSKALSIALGLALLLWMQNAIAGGILSGMRIGQTEDKTRIVFDLKQAGKYQVSQLNNPSRLVVDFFDTANYLSFKNKHVTDKRLFKIRVSNDKKRTRVVLDLHKNPQFKSFLLASKKGQKNSKDRLVIDLLKHVNKTKVSEPPKLLAAKPNKGQKVNSKQKKSLKPTSTKTAKTSTAKTVSQKKVVAKVIAPKVDKKSQTQTKEKPSNQLVDAKLSKPTGKIKLQTNSRPQPLTHLAKNKHKGVVIDKAPKSLLFKDSEVLGQKPATLVVAIDPGHGGRDPGAVGPNGAYEKNVTLMISKELKKIIDKQPGMKAVLTRDKDVFLKLHQRVKIAKRNQADIFISIHADAFQDKSIRGGSVYVLSERGASSTMARLLAKNENAALEDIRLANLDKDVAFALSDLSREANVKASKKLAKTVLKQMRKNVRMHKKEVQSAGFAVLKSIDMPSMLIETAFISNPYEAKRLMNRSFQKKMASAIADGLNQYAKQMAPKQRWGDTLYVHHRVQRGDTLSEIAEIYQVSTRTLKKVNNIKNANALYVGKKLKIPVSNKMMLVSK